MEQFSPVPKNQIPHQEFIQLKNSIFFSWPSKDIIYFYKYILLFWVISYPLFLFISTGSNYFHSNGRLFLASFLYSIIIPFFLLLRQYLGWSYVSNRLNSEFIFYEETDWHDGQVWKKPYLWYMRDKMIFREEITPVISNIKSASISLLSILLFSILFYIFL